MSRISERACAAVLLAVASSLALAQGQTTPNPTTFRSGVDLVVVEATVVDRSGEIVRDLTPSDFEVEIGGDAREIVSADLVEYQAMATGRPGWPLPDVTTNADSTSNRTILMVADQGSLSTESRSVIDAARRWIGTLPSGDRVGLVTLPPPGPRVEFTTDRAQVSTALGKLALTGQLSPVGSSLRNVGLWEAIRIEQRDQITRDLVVQRECRPQDRLCPSEIDMTAGEIVGDARSRTQPTLATLRGVLNAMGVLPGPKHVVLLTSGWPIDTTSGGSDLEPLAAVAARANIIVHAIIAESSGMTASVRRLSPSLMQDRTLAVSSVETLSGWTGGTSARVTGTGDRAFASLGGVLSGYYRLGVRPEKRDLDGRTRRISVKVTREGLSVRTHRKIMAGSPGSATTSSDPEAALLEAMTASAPLTGLTLRATSYVLHADKSAPDRLRLLVAGDVTGGSAGPAQVRLGLYDQNGRAVAGAGSEVQIRGDESGQVSATLAAPPGLYVLRVAVRDAGGRIGSLQRGIDLSRRTIEGIETTGLVLLRSTGGPDRPANPVIDKVRRDEQLVAQIVFSEPKAGRPEPSVVLEVTREGTSAPLVRRSLRLGHLEYGSEWIAQDILPAALLPPGKYTVAAIVAAGEPQRASETGPAVSALLRTIEVVPAISGRVESAAAPGDVSRSRSSVSSDTSALALFKPAAFSASSVLDPARVEPVLERLGQRVQDERVRDALHRLKSGPWPTSGSDGPLAAVPVASHFVSGLGHLQKGALDPAANAFRSALRAAPDFTPAMVYLAACYAAGGKDREAASAWQAAALRDHQSPWLHELAAEGWLRAQRPAAALALIKQARQRFPDDETFVRLEVRAQLADGRAPEGLEAMERIERPDPELMMMALATLYIAAKNATPVWSRERDLALMKQWREKYAASNGGSLGVVDSWISEVTPSPEH